ncbi:hypothetical protein [Chromobacterium subtsugae]|uniref:hypothetical protein n=1 Tax=Chromobacterium subtsugae TaxID=251747 RepID=UPI0012D3F9B0|nr:hypothetical protein [Chromobacterium subtsugae]
MVLKLIAIAVLAVYAVLILLHYFNCKEAGLLNSKYSHAGSILILRGRGSKVATVLFVYEKVLIFVGFLFVVLRLILVGL